MSLKLQHKIDGVIHFAALKAVGKSVEDPLSYYQNNVTGSSNLLQVLHVYMDVRIKSLNISFDFYKSMYILYQLVFHSDMRRIWS